MLLNSPGGLPVDSALEKALLKVEITSLSFSRCYTVIDSFNYRSINVSVPYVCVLTTSYDQTLTPVGV